MKTEHDHNRTENDHPQPGPDVTVTINGTSKDIHRGSYVVSKLKEELDVSQDLALSLDVDGQLTPLADDGRITIKGGEAFFSGARTGGSSHA